MLDHVFTDALGALREVFEGALLERQAFEERFQTDPLLGDTTWETTYGLPGEGDPPRVRADVTLQWSTWSQTTYRTWYLGDDITDPPHLDAEIVFRLQRLSETPEPRRVLDALPLESPPVGSDVLTRGGPTVETTFDVDLTDAEHAIEISYSGSYELHDELLADGNLIDEHFSALGGWIASTLVRLGDLPLHYLPNVADDAD